MKNDLELYSLRHRIFLVKQFYQELGNFVCVKNNYEDYYGGCSDSPLFCRDVLVEIIQMFEETGSVVKCPLVEGSTKRESSPMEIELICIETVPNSTNKSEGVKSEDEDVEITSVEQDILPKEQIQILEERNKEEIFKDNDENQDTETVSKKCKLKRYKCQFKMCAKTFKGLSSFQKHQETHIDQKDDHRLKCQMCMKSFIYHSSLRRHIENYHDSNVPPAQEAQEDQEQIQEISTYKQGRCKICPRSNKKYSVRCCTCRKCVCSAHRDVVCHQCRDSYASDTENQEQVIEQAEQVVRRPKQGRCKICPTSQKKYTVRCCSCNRFVCSDHRDIVCHHCREAYAENYSKNP